MGLPPRHGPRSAQSAEPLAQSAEPLAQSAEPLAHSAAPLAHSAAPSAHSAALSGDWLHNIPIPPAHLWAIAGALVAERVRPARVTWADPARLVVGLALLGAGTAVVVGSVAVARPVRLDEPVRLVTSGPYRWSRNPMYVAWALLHLGVALLGRSGWALGALVPAVVRVHVEVAEEERMLAVRFPGEYARYCATVPRYVGRRRRVSPRASR